MWHPATYIYRALLTTNNRLLVSTPPGLRHKGESMPRVSDANLWEGREREKVAEILNVLRFKNFQMHPFRSSPHHFPHAASDTERTHDNCEHHGRGLEGQLFILDITRTPVSCLKRQVVLVTVGRVFRRSSRSRKGLMGYDCASGEFPQQLSMSYQGRDLPPLAFLGAPHQQRVDGSSRHHFQGHGSGGKRTSITERCIAAGHRDTQTSTPYV